MHIGGCVIAASTGRRSSFCNDPRKKPPRSGLGKVTLAAWLPNRVHPCNAARAVTAAATRAPELRECAAGQRCIRGRSTSYWLATASLGTSDGRFTTGIQW